MIGEPKEFLSCDWGTTSFRLRRVNFASGAILEESRQGSGVKALFLGCPTGNAVARESAFAEFVRNRLRSLAGLGEPGGLAVQVVISGMASSSVGWRELPYASVPCPLDGSGVAREVIDLDLGDGRWARIHLISGLATADEIMRGEETELLGLFAEGRYAEIAANGIVVLPGTHAKHVRVRDREVEGFHTYMTGELFDVLATHSLLRASVEGEAKVSGEEALGEPQARSAFLTGVGRARDPGLARSLFQVRTRVVLHGVSPAVNRWFLSGLLIGAEVTDLATRDGKHPILLAATEPVSAGYRLAFEALGLSERLVVAPPEEVALASAQAHRLLLRRWLAAETAAVA